MDLALATHHVVDHLGLVRGWPDWIATHDFQVAFNGRIPAFTGTTPLKLDGIYGPRTSAAVGEAIAWLEQQGLWSDTPASSVATSGFDLGQVVHDVTHPDLKRVAHDTLNLATTIDLPALAVKEGVHVSEHGWGALGHDAAHATTDVVHAVKDVDQVVRAARPYIDMGLSAVEGVTSMIPGIGTGISAALGTAQAILDGGGTLAIAIRTAYATIPIPDGLRQVTDPIVDAVLALASGKSVTDAAIYAIRDQLPKGLPQQVFDTLAHVLAKKVAIEKRPADVSAHFVTRYTAGPAAASAASAHHVPRPVRPHLARAVAAARGAGPLPPLARPRPPPPKPRPPVAVDLAPSVVT